MLTNLDWLRVGEEFPPASEKDRLEKYADNRKLWDGRQTEVYGGWYRVLREQYGVSHEIVFNFHKRLSTLWSQLVFGDAPVFGAGESEEVVEGETLDENPEQDAIDRIVEGSQFATVGREAVIDDSRYGDALIKLRLKEGRAFLQAQSPAVWFPVVSLDDQRDILYHVLAWTFEVDEVIYLRAEVHEKGFIENMLFVLTDGIIRERVMLSKFFPSRMDREETRLNDFMVFHIPGLRASDEFFGKDDYTDIDSLILERMARAGQLSRIQDTHSDPNMYGPADYIADNAISGRPEVTGGGQYFPVPEDQSPPGYMTWDGSQAAQFQLMEVLKQDLYEVSETTPTAFGSSATGYAESGTSLRLRMVPPLAKARDIRSRFDPVVKKALILAAALEKAWGVQDASVPETINVTWKDGLPHDPREQSAIEAERLQSGNTSRFSSIRRLDGGTDAETQEELDRIDEDGETQNAIATRPIATPEGEPVEGPEDTASRAEQILEGLRNGAANAPG